MAPVAGSAANVAGAEPSVGLPSPTGLESSPTLVCSQIWASAFTLPSLRALQSMPVVTVPAALPASVALAGLGRILLRGACGLVGWRRLRLRGLWGGGLRAVVDQAFERR